MSYEVSIGGSYRTYGARLPSYSIPTIQKETMMKKINRVELLELLDAEIMPMVDEAVARYPDAEALVIFENQDMCSSAPSNTFPSVADCEGKHINDLPSQRQHATYYWTIGG